MAGSPEKLGESLEEALQEGLKVAASEGAKLSALADARLQNGQPIDDLTLNLLYAAFAQAEQFNRAAKDIIHGVGHIFLLDGKLPSSGVVESVVQTEIAAGGGVLKPTTFAQLLRQRIEDIFSPDQTTIPLRELLQISGGTARSEDAMQTAIRSVGLGDRGSDEYNRDEALNAVHAFLITPTSGRFSLRDTYGRAEVFRSFKINASQLDAWSKEIDFAWYQTPTVDGQTALEIRGLGALEAIIAARKNHSPI